jgi:hypothetical protein
MAKIDNLGQADWENYHETVKRVGVDRRALVAVPAIGEAPAAFLRRTASAVMALLQEARAGGRTLQIIGSGWSFSDLVDGDGILLNTHLAPAVFRITSSRAPGKRLVLVSGGTTVSTLNAFLMAQGLSLETSGAHDGQTIAGACATSVHGSRIGHGAFQNHVRGIHLVTGPGDSIWLEPGDVPLVGTDFIADLGARHVDEPDSFAAALVHLGGMGFVNAYLLEVADRFDLAIVRRELPIGPAQLQRLQAGEFSDFGQSVWPESQLFFPAQPPAYVEVIYNPFSHVTPGLPSPRNSIVYLGYQTGVQEQAEASAVASIFFQDVLNRIMDQAEQLADRLTPPWLLPEVLLLVDGNTPPPGHRPASKPWGQVFGKVTKRPFELYNAALAIKRQDLVATVDTLQQALLADGVGEAGALVFTLRFVSGAAGLLAFQRFAETAVINVDGIRSSRARASAQRMVNALDATGISFSQHWGKQGILNATRIAREFGPQSNPESLLSRWQRARSRLMEPDMRLVFSNKALIDWDLA